MTLGDYELITYTIQVSKRLVERGCFDKLLNHEQNKVAGLISAYRLTGAFAFVAADRLIQELDL